MFLGSHSITMDAKGRVAIPTRVRDLLSGHCNNHIVLTASTEDKCLILYPKPEWDEIAPKIESLPSRKSKFVRRTKLLMLGYANEMEVDANGRILIPPTLRDYAGLDKKLIIVGQGKKLEIWCEDKFKAWIEEDDDEETMPDELAELDF